MYHYAMRCFVSAHIYMYYYISCIDISTSSGYTCIIARLLL
jgi:hypothetical protein